MAVPGVPVTYGPPEDSAELAEIERAKAFALAAARRAMEASACYTAPTSLEGPAQAPSRASEPAPTMLDSHRLGQSSGFSAVWLVNVPPPESRAFDASWATVRSFDLLGNVSETEAQGVPPPRFP